MKKKVSKAGALLIALAMTTAMFSGCNTAKKNSSENAPTETNGAAKSGADKYAPVDGKAYEISYLTAGYAAADPNSEIVKKYNDTFNVKLNPVYVEAAKFDDLLNIKLASDEIPDVFPSKTIDKFLKYQGQGLLSEVPLDVLKKYSPNLVNTINEDAPDSWVACKQNGKNYGIPYIVASYMFRDAIVWRTDWLKNVGIEKIPDTLEEWEQALTKFKNNDPDKNGKNDTFGCSSSIFASVFGAHGVIVDMWWGSYWLEKDGKIVYSAIEPAAKDALKLLNKWYTSGLLDPEFVTGENKGGYWAVSTDFVNGRIGVSGMGNAGHWQKKVGNGEVFKSGVNETELLKINSNATFDYGNPPLGPDGKTRGNSKSSLNTGFCYVFSKNLTSEPDKLGKILQMFDWPASSQDNWLFNAYGTEGKDYTIKKLDNYNVYVRNEIYTDAAKRDAQGFGGFFYQMDKKSYSLVNSATYDYNMKAGLDKYGVEDLATKLVMPSYGKYQADLTKMLTEAYVNIIIGKKPIEYFDEFVKNWKSAGGEQLLKEANEFYQKSSTK